MPWPPAPGSDPLRRGRGGPQDRRPDPPRQVVLGGERGGLAVKGFDLGNSPEDYTADRLRGKTLVITTTNGTRAMAHAQTASRIFLGAFVNVSAFCEQLQGRPAIHVLCAGTDGQSSEDDILMAGMLVDRLQRREGLGYMLNAQAITAQEMWLHEFALPLALGAETLETGAVGRGPSRHARRPEPGRLGIRRRHPGRRPHRPL